MSDNQNASAVAEQATNDQSQSAAADQPPYQYDIKIDDAGPAAKKISIEIPQEHIASKLAEQLKDLRREVSIPGFRPGHAPQKLVEKRFGQDIKEQVRRQLVSESYEQALERNKLQAVGEPEFEGGDDIQIPDSGPMRYAFTIEVQPEIKLPDLKGLKVRKPKVAVKDENIDLAMNNLREQQGTLAPVEGRGVQAKDYLTTDVHLKLDGNVVSHQHDAHVVVRPGRVAGIQVDDLETQLAGLKPGETRTLTLKAPETHANEALRGKEVQLEVTLKDIKTLELPELNQEFFDSLGFATEAELRDALREQMLERVDFDVKRNMRDQVSRFLAETIELELPPKLSERQIDRVVRRRSLDLMVRGLTDDQLQTAIEQLRANAKDEVKRELKLSFILQKVAEAQGVTVDESELNGQIAMIAAQRGRRPEKIKQDMAREGTLNSLYLQLIEEKAIDKVLESADIEEVEPDKT